jgi:hypothetical protein
MATLEELEEALVRAREEQNAAYWTFTRCARGKPVSPDITRRIVALERQVAELKWGPRDRKSKHQS